ncbi:MAG: hypothetical protein DRP85_06150 [Candidatus Makaraimicrobium thalassicum]|nr:MAG: hypothetical protein DRP85_06150 [Candidatus Omnitrophota bacterium]
MKRGLAVVFMVGIALALAFPQEGKCREQENLYGMLSGKSAVKTHVSDITDSSGGNEVDVIFLKEALENALATRLTINFELVPGKENADIIIDCDITEFLWTAEDPVDNITGIAGIAMDTLVTENYARIQAVFSVTDAAGGEQLWRRELKATLTSKDMPRQKSISMVSERLVKIFMRECFSKTHGAR